MTAWLLLGGASCSFLSRVFFRFLVSSFVVSQRAGFGLISFDFTLLGNKSGTAALLGTSWETLTLIGWISSTGLWLKTFIIRCQTRVLKKYFYLLFSSLLFWRDSSFIVFSDWTFSHISWLSRRNLRKSISPFTLENTLIPLCRRFLEKTCWHFWIMNL